MQAYQHQTGRGPQGTGDGSRGLTEVEQQSPLLLLTTFEPTKMTRIKLIQYYAEGQRKVEVPVFQSQSAEEVLYALNEFRAAAQELEYEDEELFNNFRKICGGLIKQQWDVVCTAQIPRTTAGFARAIRALLKEMLGRGAYERFISYIESTVKPKTLDPLALALRFRTLMHYARDLPTEDGEAAIVPTDSRMKQLYLRLCPHDWRVKFQEANLQVSTMTLSDIANYMSNLRSFESPSSRGRRNFRPYTSPTSRSGNNGGGSSGRRFGGRVGGGRGFGGRGRHSSGRSGGRNFQRQRMGPSPEDPCPLHNGLHLWKDCRQNRYGQPATAGRGGGRNHNGRQQNENFYTQAVPSRAGVQQVAPPLHPHSNSQAAPGFTLPGGAGRADF